jgi:CheY-like chemotaxis protein
MGGTIDAESAPGEGTRFRFTALMGRAREPAAPPSAPPQAASASQLRVLVAEDNRVNQKLILVLLKGLGVDADLAPDGAQAITAAEGSYYDLILMDVEMPEVDGLTATREIRSRLPLDRQPVVFGLTTHVTAEYRGICVAAGMDGYLTKPIEQDKLRDLIADLSMRTSLRNLTSGGARRPPLSGRS